jgi:hypothetical protein
LDSIDRGESRNPKLREKATGQALGMAESGILTTARERKAKITETSVFEILATEIIFIKWNKQQETI